ncbi:MAG TPA: DUF6183 family protein [Acidimicrobiales bacterium]|nr:DUF6183 family protein [Acidimicrobiales bacterium]
MSDASARLVERGDLDGLTRHVDRLCEQRAWDDLVALRDRCRLALGRGKQLWPVASHIEYRLALEAPGPWAAATLETGTGRFALGPLPEVAASTHAWAELAPHLTVSPAGAMAAHERVMRGEDLTADPHAAALPPILDLPFALQPWEPAYALAEYHADRMEAPSPGIVRPGRTRKTPGRVVAARAADDPDAVRALTDLAETWTVESNGRAEAVAVHGPADAAVNALGAPSPALTELGPRDALALMAWAAASGGAHGRRRGSAPGRFAAWWALAALGGLLEDWPVPAGELGEVLEALCWYAWEAGEPETGWVLRLAVEDPDEGLAWALAAVDLD